MPTSNPEPLNVENLARALLETRIQACDKYDYVYTLETGGADVDDPTFEQLDEDDKQILREQARLLLNRWMR